MKEKGGRFFSRLVYLQILIAALAFALLAFLSLSFMGAIESRLPDDACLTEIKRIKLSLIALGAVLAALFVTVILRLSTAHRELQSVKDELGLNDREREILPMLLEGLPVKQIAYKLELTISGINYHVQNIYRKLGVQSRAELLSKFVETSDKI